MWVRGASNTADVPETSRDVPFPIVPVPPPPKVTGVALTANMAAPQPAGTTITWSAQPTGGVAPYQSKWLVYRDAWTAVTGWTTSNTFAWTPTAANPDAKVSVWVRSANKTADEPETSRDVPFPIVAATSPTAPVPPVATPIRVALTASVTATPATILAGGTITVTVANGPGHIADWVAVVAAGAPDSSYLDWKYLSGSTAPPPAGLTSATVQLMAPTMPGTYEVRFWARGGFTRLATSSSLTVQGVSALAPTVTATPATGPVRRDDHGHRGQRAGPCCGLGRRGPNRARPIPATSIGST